MSPSDICKRAGTVTEGLWETACKRRILFGTALATSDLRSPDYAELVAKECAIVTPTWEMKWRPLQPERGRFDFAATDRLAAFAQSYAMALRGHTLVWHLEMPDWLFANLSASNWHDLMEAHMEAVIGRYASAVSSWDVVNEAIEPLDGRSDGMRDSPWLRSGGADYVTAAFQLAGRLAPDAQLVYNDYGCEHEAEWTRRRQAAVLKLLERLKKSDAPVHALGLQSHLRVGDDFSSSSFERFLDEVRELGVVPIVTELDVRADRMSSAAAKDAKAADLARRYLDVVLAKGCETIVCWGLSDDKSWRAAQEPQERPLPFDRKLVRKPIYDAIEAAIVGLRI